MRAAGTAFGPFATTFAVLGGASLWAGMFAALGALTERASAGAACGTVVGGLIGYGYTRKKIGGVVVWVSVSAVVGVLIGPGCDADPCISAVGGAVLGSLFGWFGWTAALMLIVGHVGAYLGSSFGWPGIAAGWLLGAVLAWLAVQADRRNAAREGLNTLTPEPRTKLPADSDRTALS